MENMITPIGKYVVNADRYEELVAKENELHLLKNALASKDNYIDITEIKRIFNIESEETNNA